MACTTTRAVLRSRDSHQASGVAMTSRITVVSKHSFMVRRIACQSAALSENRDSVISHVHDHDDRLCAWQNHSESGYWRPVAKPGTRQNPGLQHCLHHDGSPQIHVPAAHVLNRL